MRNPIRKPDVARRIAKTAIVAHSLRSWANESVRTTEVKQNILSKPARQRMTENADPAVKQLSKR